MSSAGRKRATLAAVARAAGVSLPTVSKVLNGRGHVAVETRHRVERVLRANAYSPHSREERSSRCVELLFESMSSPVTVAIVNGATIAAAAEDADIVLRLMPVESESSAWPSSRAALDRAGVVVVGSRLSSVCARRFAVARLPLVLLDPVNVPDEQLRSVGATVRAGAIAATRHLIELGHRRIAIIVGQRETIGGMARLAGYQAAMCSAALAVDPDWVRTGGSGFESAHEHAVQLLSLKDRPTAIFAGNDMQAFGVIEAARKLSLRVAEDLSVVGFDDVDVAAWSVPPLTTVRQPFADMARLAVTQVLQLADGIALDRQRVELPTQLIVRESTAAPPAERFG